MKKIISFLLILLILCLFLVACNRNNNDTDTSKDTQSSVSPSTDLNKDTSTDVDADTNIDTNVDTDNPSQAPEEPPLLPDTSNDSEAETDIDTNTDTNTDINIDTDTNTDTDTDTDTDVDTDKIKAPNITITDYNGNEITLESLRGKGVVLNFWASWCPPCKAEMPDFEEAYKEYGDDVQFVMVSLLAWGHDTVETAKEFYEQSGYTFPVYFDTKNQGYQAYGINAIPQTFFIDKDGYLVSHVPQMITKEVLYNSIEAIIE